MNYQKELEKVLDEVATDMSVGELTDTSGGTAPGLHNKPTLLLHSCCAPCSSYVLLYLAKYFDIIDFFYNPNISPKDEYDKRSDELERLVDTFNKEFGYSIEFVAGNYEPDVFFEMAKGLEDVPEGGERCFKCYRLRLMEAAKLARELNADYFTTTLSISPLKNAEKLNEIGLELEKIYGVKHLPSDFKKKDGYKTSIELSKKYDLYRQNYCGCVFSKKAGADANA